MSVLLKEAKRWRYVEAKFDGGSRHASRNILEGLGLPDDDECAPFARIIDAAIAAQMRANVAEQE